MKTPLILLGLLGLILASACAQPIDLPPELPLADAGDDQLRQLLPGGRTVGLDGRASCDPLGEHVAVFRWRLLSVPEGSAAELDQADSVHPSFLADLAGRYSALLIVEADGRESQPDEVTVELRDELAEDFPPSVPTADRCGEELP